MDRGYIRLWRKSLDSGWLKNHKLWAFWSWCLMKATHKEFDAIVGLQTVHLEPGQFVFGLKKASEETGLSIQETRTVLAFLSNAGNLTIKTTNKFSVITVINWPTYQGEDIDEQHTDQQTTNKQLTTYKHIRNISSSKKKKILPKKEKAEKLVFHENVKLTEAEYDRLINEFGQGITEKAIKFLSDYKIEKKYKTQDDNLTIRRWVISAVMEKERNKNGTSGKYAGNRIRTQERERITVGAIEEASAIRREYEAECASTNDRNGKETG